MERHQQSTIELGRCRFRTVLFTLVKSKNLFFYFLDLSYPPLCSDVPCNDTVACPDETTCCKNVKGGWNCCPLPQAVCCEDFLHCCPHGKKCNLAAMTCDDPSGSIPWLEKKPSRPIGGQNKEKGKAAAANVSCDSSHFCPASSTCCKDVNAEWSCLELEVFRT
uniref:Granulin a n=1 Tax=Astyanax mexicanus TaxID=7994 RepID=A0A3B1IRE1_ASTMX